MNQHLKIMEVGPRDGLQNQARTLPPATRRRYVELLIDAGVQQLEAGAFVRHDRVPQMADSQAVLKGLDLKGAKAFFLIPNEKGLEQALGAGVSHVAVFTAATDGFNRKNIGMSMEESLAVIRSLVPKAKTAGMIVRGYVSVVWGCPYDGTPKFDDILRMCEELLSAGCYEVSLGDTIGIAGPGDVLEMLSALGNRLPLDKLAGHFHDTRGMGVANAHAAIQQGIRTLDGASGGLGGCPFAPGATGNVGTEDLVYMARSLGFDTGIDLEKLAKASQFVHHALGLTTFGSKTLQTLPK